jgi:hypothetical protein
VCGEGAGAWSVVLAEDPGFLDEVGKGVLVVLGCEGEPAALDDVGAEGFDVVDAVEGEASVEHGLSLVMGCGCHRLVGEYVGKDDPVLDGDGAEDEYCFHGVVV